MYLFIYSIILGTAITVQALLLSAYNINDYHISVYA